VVRQPCRRTTAACDAIPAQQYCHHRRQHAHTPCCRSC
jgi:hypothetical protein